MVALTLVRHLRLLATIQLHQPCVFPELQLQHEGFLGILHLPWLRDRDVLLLPPTSSFEEVVDCDVPTTWGFPKIGDPNIVP